MAVKLVNKISNVTYRDNEVVKIFYRKFNLSYLEQKIIFHISIHIYNTNKYIYKYTTIKIFHQINTKTKYLQA